MKKQRLFPSKNSTPYWSILAYHAGYKFLLKPNNFMDLLQVQYKNDKASEKGKQPHHGLHS
ncbi:MAG: hypothetical protein ABI621_01115 [Chloroflexota bacterium]